MNGSYPYADYSLYNKNYYICYIFVCICLDILHRNNIICFYKINN